MELLLLFSLFAPLAGSLFAALFANKSKSIAAGVVPSALLVLAVLSSLSLLGAVLGGTAGFLIASGMGMELELQKGTKLELELSRPLYIEKW